MKYSFTLAALAQVSSVLAFPAVIDAVNKRAQPQPQPGGTTDPSTRFDAASQFVSTTGDNAFVAPNLDTDARGPCPGLNALANHGYLPHNGVGTHLDFITATFKGFGMSADLSGFLTVLGATIDGNGLEWSIGGPNAALPGAPPLLGVPQGISGSHNKYETDVSPGRGDLYTSGTDYELQMDRFQKLYDRGMANGDDITLETMSQHRSELYDDSMQNNPYFFMGPFTGVLVSPAAFTFVYRFMSNKSAEYPQGKLNTDILMSFFGVTKNADGSLTKQPGMERFPENWYKRAVGDEYSIPFFQLDLLAAGAQYPKFFDIGGNVGKPNSFIGVNVEDLTGGAMNAQQLTQGNNLVCFAMNFAAQAAVDQIKCSGVLGQATSALATLNKQLATSIQGLDCPELANLSQNQFDQFPGYTKLDCQSGEY